MIKLTDKEVEVVKAFYAESIDCCGSCDDSANLSWYNAQDLIRDTGWSAQEVGGVMSSLEEKRIIEWSPRGEKAPDWSLKVTRELVVYVYGEHEAAKGYWFEEVA